VLALTTGVGDHVDDRVDALNGNQGTRVARVARLSAWFAPALHVPTSFALPPGKPVGGRRFRSRRRILLTKGELPFQIGDALGLLGNLPLTFGKLPSQALHFVLQALVGVLARRSLGPRHASTVRRSVQFVQPPELLRMSIRQCPKIRQILPLMAFNGVLEGS
jgi:hypothetical protein